MAVDIPLLPAELMLFEGGKDATVVTSLMEISRLWLLRSWKLQYNLNFMLKIANMSLRD